MKYFVLFVCMTGSLFAKAQSPGLGITASMSAENAKAGQYKIEMKFCWPKKQTEKEGWFTHDTSYINFTKLKADDVTCGRFAGNGDGIEVLSGNKTFAKYNFYEYHNQVFAWEAILVFRISDSTEAAQSNAMYIVLPVKYKSFTTSIKIEDIVFQAGQLVYLDNAEAKYVSDRLRIQTSLKNVEGTDVRDSGMREWVE